MYRYRRTWLGRRKLQISVSRPAFYPIIGRVHEERWRDATPAECLAYEGGSA